MPRLNEKKAWPNACRITWLLILLKSGRSRKEMPSFAPSSVSELMTSPISSRIMNGITILPNFSIPFSTPRTTMKAMKAMKAKVQNMGPQPWSMYCWKTVRISSELCRWNPFTRATCKNLSAQPAITA